MPARLLRSAPTWCGTAPDGIKSAFWPVKSPPSPAPSKAALGTRQRTGPAAYYTSGGIAITLSNAPAFAFNFASAALGGVAQFFANTYTYPTVTVTIASPGVVTYVGHGKSANDPVAFFNNGDTLPTGLVLGTTYYVKTVLTADTFTLSATAGGAVINTSGSQSGTHKLGATGSRYNASQLGIVDSAGGGASALPGNAAGATASGGQYT